MKAEIRCNEHGITKANYYYRLRRVRKACLEACNPEPAFVELPVPATETMSSADFHDVKPAAILRNARGLAFEIYNHASLQEIRQWCVQLAALCGRSSGNIIRTVCDVHARAGDHTEASNQTKR